MRDGPERRCIATGQSGPTAGLIRFVVGPDRALVPDLSGRLPGRGIWVSAERAALERAVKKRLFARAARNEVTVPDGLVDAIETALVRRIVELVSLARKSGAAVAGRGKVADALAAGDLALLVQASDGSERERRELRPPAGDDSLVDVLDAAELGRAFGRDRVVHAGVFAGGLADNVRYESGRLRGVRGGPRPLADGGTGDGASGPAGKD